MGPLSAFEPIITFFGTLSAALSLFLGVFVLALVVAPGVLVLLAHRPTEGVWRWPATWLLPSLAAVFVVSGLVPRLDTPSPISWGSLAMSAGWGLTVLVVGGGQLLLRVVKFTFTPSSLISTTGEFARLVYGWGAVVCAAASALAALTEPGPQRPWQALWALSLGVLAFLTLRRSAEAAAPRVRETVSARLRWLSGAGLLALLSPAFAAALLAFAEHGWPAHLTNGHLLLVMLLPALAFASWLHRGSRLTPTR